MLKKLGRAAVSLIYLIVLSLVAGAICGITGVDNNGRGIFVLGVVITYWTTRNKVLRAIGLQ